MNENPSRYGGLAAVFVFGTGLLIVGFSLPADQHARAVSMRWAGAFVLTFAILTIVISLSASTTRVLIVSTLAGICSAVLVYSATSSELTGKAVYHRNFLARHGWRTEAVTREQAPDKFREATNVRWALALLCAMGSTGCFMLYRKAEYLDDF
jgi:hypothetical protein